MATAGTEYKKRASGSKGLLRAVVLVTGALLSVASALGEEKAQILVTREDGYARLVLSFPQLLELPAYKIKSENGILAIEFDTEIDLLLPDVSAALPEYVSIARIDPDAKGVRFGLRTVLNFNRTEAGEKLFIDLLPTTWQGLPPSLPPEIVAELARRAKEAAELAEQRRKAEEAKIVQPTASVRVGQNPTFMRVQFDWTVDTKAQFMQDGTAAELLFDWPVAVDVTNIKGDLAPELLGVDNSVAADGSRISFQLAEGVKPRFYKTSERQFIVDIDLVPKTGPEMAEVPSEVNIAASALFARLGGSPELQVDEPSSEAPEADAGPVQPFVERLGETVRIVFPFAEETPSAVFRRGDMVWMLFDTASTIMQLDEERGFSEAVGEFAATRAGDTQVVSMALAQDRLATLGSEGTAWVLTLGDLLLAPTVPVALNRRQDIRGEFEVTADFAEPARVHEFRDPVVGDILKVVSAYPPARGVARDQKFVDFAALSSAHGLVIRPEHDEVDVAVEGRLAVVRADGGLVLSSQDAGRALDLGREDSKRGGFVDFVTMEAAGIQDFRVRQQEMSVAAASLEGPQRDKARLDLARFYLANQFGIEAIGVLEVLDAELKSKELQPDVSLSMAIASTLASRPLDALRVLNSTAQSEQVDAVMWRVIAKTDAGDYEGARVDAMASEGVISSYPSWVQNKFLLSAIRSAVETGDRDLAIRYIGKVDARRLDSLQASMLKLLSGRLDELEDRLDEAIETYGEVITADIRPSRAEAIYRTLKILDQRGELDEGKATASLGAESMLWRGNALEADMLKFLAELQFRKEEFRQGFETVRMAAESYPDSRPTAELLDLAQSVFGQLYLDGFADQMEPIEALGIYYDFRQMTPPGARGDEMIRNLARRLVKVDLLEQAADLLEYQIDNRLNGVARAQIAADLAVIEIADRNPQGALRTLSKTHMADLSPALQRQRRILEARALIDAGRHELALDMMSRLEGRDVELLRIDAHWQARRFAQAGALLEALNAPSGADGKSTKSERMGLIKAAVGFVIAEDKLGLSRLRSKFAQEMAQTPEWAMFDFVTSDLTPTHVEFKKVAREIAGLDSLNAFLEAYRSTYGGAGALAPTRASTDDGVA